MIFASSRALNSVKLSAATIVLVAAFTISFVIFGSTNASAQASEEGNVGQTSEEAAAAYAAANCEVVAAVEARPSLAVWAAGWVTCEADPLMVLDLKFYHNDDLIAHYGQRCVNVDPENCYTTLDSFPVESGTYCTEAAIHVLNTEPTHEDKTCVTY